MDTRVGSLVQMNEKAWGGVLKRFGTKSGNANPRVVFYINKPAAATSKSKKASGAGDIQATGR